MKRLLCMLAALLLPWGAWAASVEEEAISFLQEAGIVIAGSEMTGIGIADFDMEDSLLTVTLENGGRAECWTGFGFDRYEPSWRFYDAADADVALYLDHVLALLAELEGGGTRDDGVIVSNALLDLERMGTQGLRVLMEQLSRHDGQDALNSLRARLASRLLGSLDASPVPPEEGCAWYDALELAVQGALPPVDASVYVEDPLLRAATQLMIAREEERRLGYSWGWDVDPAKTCTVVTLQHPTVRTEGNRATVYAYVRSQKYALYDGTHLRGLSGSGVPSRIGMALEDGVWVICDIVESEDGTRYWPSVLAFCEGDEALAESILTGESGVQEQAVALYLESIGVTLPEDGV